MSLNNKVILITGGTGSFGKFFTKFLLKNSNPKKIIIFSRDELKQYEMQNDFIEHKKKLRFFIGDIRDLSRLNLAMKNVDIVIHAAALKQVTTAEYNPFEAVKTNVLGSQNIIDASINNNVKKVIALSTDKASSPINLYGATKLTSDKLFLSANNYKGDKNICFSVVRYGNVMGSRGSVIPFFINQKSMGKIDITDKRMTRFNITLNEASNFVMKILSLMKGGEIFIPKIPSYRILDLKNAIAKKAKINLIGIRPGEKLHEEMISKEESVNVIEFNNYYIMLPDSEYSQLNINKYKSNAKKNGAKIITKPFSYNSEKNKHFLTVEELTKLISKNIKPDNAKKKK